MANLSDSDRRLIVARIRELRKGGKPQEASRLTRALAEDHNPPANLMGKTGFKPEKDIAVALQDLEIPPRAGRGASKDAWGDFALTVADIEPQIIDALNRDEIIELLESRGIIDKDGEVVESEVGETITAEDAGVDEAEEEEPAPKPAPKPQATKSPVKRTPAKRTSTKKKPAPKSTPTSKS